VLLGAVREGLALLTWEDETFAFADGFDATRAKYQGLRAGQQVSVSADGTDLLVKPDAARQHLDAERKPEPTGEDDGSSGGGPVGGEGSGGAGGTGTEWTGPGPGGTVRLVKARPKRFHGAISLDPLRIGRDASQIAQEIVQHLFGLVGARIEVTLEIQAEIPDGVPEHVIRTVAENCRTLRFTTHGFEEE
jgi:hypothetical protein